jgi:WD40 repeat protein
MSLSFNNTGEKLAIVSAKHYIDIWNIPQKQKEHTIDFGERFPVIYDGLFNPSDNNLLAVRGSDYKNDSVIITDILTDEQEVIDLSGDNAGNLQFDHTGTILYIPDTENRTIIRFDLSKNIEIDPIPMNEGYTDIKLNSDSTLLLSTGGTPNIFELWEIDTMNILHRFDNIHNITRVVFHPIQPIIAVGTFGPIHIVSYTGEILHKLLPEFNGKQGRIIRDVVFNLDGTLLFGGIDIDAMSNDFICVWRTDTWEIKELLIPNIEGIENKITRLAVSSTNLLASGHSDGTVKIWQI